MNTDELIHELVPPNASPEERTRLTNEILQVPSDYIRYRLPGNPTRDQILALYKQLLTTVAPPPPPPPPPSTVTVPPRPTSLTVSGFYGPSLTANVLSVYLTQNAPIVPGMTITGLTGIQQRVIVQTYTSNVYGDVIINPGPPSISFPYVALVTAMIEGMGTVPVAPSSMLQLTFGFEKLMKMNSTAHGFRGPLVTGNTFSVYIVDQFTGPMPDKDWKVTGFSDPVMLLVDVAGNLAVTNLTPETGTANVLSGAITKPQKYLYRLDVVTDQQQVMPLPSSTVLLTFMRPSSLIESKYYSMYDPKLFDASLIKGQTAELRDLNSNVYTDVPAPRDALIEMAGRGFGTGALTALAAIGPQEKYMYGGESLWMPKILQHTPFAITQRFLLPLKSGNEKFLKSTRTFSVDIHPRESGDLLSNMYLSVSLPALPVGYNYTPLVGRAIIKKVEFLIDGQPIETLTDDWYILRDQLFLDADEKLAMYQATSLGQSESNVVPATDIVKMMIPLDFFFCRRHSDRKIGREKLEKPFFPLCAILKQTVTIRFTFHDSTWITNAPADANGKPIDIINPKVLLEEITLSPQERMYYQSHELNYKVNRVWSEAGQPYSKGKAVMNLTANFPVSMITWFVRNQNYEDEKNEAYYKSRYQYGYSTDYILAAVPVTFFNGVTINFLDIIQSGTLYLNNQNVLSNFPGALYYSYKQAIDHNLSVPTKSIYMYCFGDSPKEYNQEGYIDFSTLNSQTTHLDLIFDPILSPQIEKSYTMYLYYYGYVPLQISGGYARLLSR